MATRSYSEGDELLIANAIRHLKAAAMALRAARCPLTLKKIRSAIKSAEGAANNAHARQFRAARRRCPACGSEEKELSLGYTNLAPYSGYCVDCINRATRTTQP